MHSGQRCSIMVQLHWNCRKDHISQQLCEQGTSLEDVLMYNMSVEYKESTSIQPTVIRITQLTAFQALKIGVTSMVTCTIQIRVNMTGRQTISQIYSQLLASQIQHVWICKMSVLDQLLPDWFGQYGGIQHWLLRGLRSSMQLELGQICKSWISRTECFIMFSPGTVCYVMENFIESNITKEWKAFACEYCSI